MTCHGAGGQSRVNPRRVPECCSPFQSTDSGLRGPPTQFYAHWFWPDGSAPGAVGVQRWDWRRGCRILESGASGFPWTWADSFFSRICRCYVCDKEFNSGEPDAMAQGKSTRQPSQASPVFQIPAELTWGLPFGGIWRRSVVVDGPEGREG